MNCLFLLPNPALGFYVKQYTLLTPSPDCPHPEQILPGSNFDLNVNLEVYYKAELTGFSQNFPLRKWAVGVMLFLVLTKSCLAQPFGKIPDSLAYYLRTAPPDTNYLRAGDAYVWWLINPLSQWASADSLLHRMETIAKRLNDPMGLQRTYWQLGLLANLRVQPKQGLLYFKQAHRLILKHHLPPSELQRVLSRIGQAYNFDQKEKALKCNLAAIRLTEEYQLTDHVVRAYLNVVTILYQTNRQQEALKYIQKAYALAPYDQDKTMLWLAEFYMGQYLAQVSEPKQTKQALVHFEKALAYANRYGSKNTLCQTLIELGRIFMDLNLSKKAFFYFKQSERVAEQFKITNAKQYGYYQLGNYYQHEKEYGQSEAYYKKSMQIAYKANDHSFIQHITDVLAQLYAQSHQYQKAYEQQVKLIQFKDSLSVNQTAQKTHDILVRYENEKKEARIRLLNEQNQRTKLERNALLIGSLLTVALAIAVAAWLLNRARLRRLKEAQQLRKQLAHDLHDEMGSTLSSISLLSSMSNDLLHQSGPAGETLKLVQRMVAKIFTDTRQMQETIDELIWMVKPGTDSFTQIADHIRAYAEPLLASKGITFRFVFDSALEYQPVSLEIRRNLYLLGKEAINNVVKYAQATQVTLRFDYQHELLTVIIEDNGRGFDPAVSTTRMGLQSMDHRAKAMGGWLAIRSAPGQGTSLRLTVSV